MENTDEIKVPKTDISIKVIVGVLILAAVASGLMFNQRLTQWLTRWRGKQLNNQVNNQVVQSNSRPVIKVAPVDKAELPEGLPSNLPLEKEAEILRNEKLTAEKNGVVEVQSRRTFISNHSLEANKVIYMDYLRQNGWEVADSASPDDIAVLIGQKDGGRRILRIIISKLKAPPGADIALTGSEVDITLTEIKTEIK